MAEDPYKTLGVARDASADDIRNAYRKLAKQNHPDLNPGNKAAEERFKSISAANELLSDTEKRGKYDRGEIDASGQERPESRGYRSYAESAQGDRYGHPGAQQEAWQAEDLDDIFGDLFGARQAGGGTPRPRRGRDDHYTLTIAFVEAINGAQKRLTLPDGKTLDVKVPVGVEEGQAMRLRGQGRPGRNGGAAGDALIEIHVEPHRVFRRDGQNIRLDLPITVREAVLGGSVLIPTPGGRIKMTIPPHSDTGRELRLRGRGVPPHGKQEAGDLYVTLRVVIGEPDAALETFLRDWQPEHPVDPRRDMERDT